MNTTMKRSKIRRKARREVERKEAANRAERIKKLDAPKRRLEAVIAARGKQI